MKTQREKKPTQQILYSLLKKGYTNSDRNDKSYGYYVYIRYLYVSIVTIVIKVIFENQPLLTLLHKYVYCEKKCFIIFFLLSRNVNIVESDILFLTTSRTTTNPNINLLTLECASL